jgi:hypothetical protein
MYAHKCGAHIDIQGIGIHEQSTATIADLLDLVNNALVGVDSNPY